MERVSAQVEQQLASAGQVPGARRIDSDVCKDLGWLSNDENERLIALCEAPALLWHHEPTPARAPEPFGMIA